MTDRKTAADFPPEVLSLFDRYVHGGLDRRGFLDAAARVTAGGTTGAVALLAALQPDFARGEQVAGTDARIVAETIDFPSPLGYGSGRGYLVRPASPSRAATAGLPIVLVIHENRGLNPHIEDVARRLALADFIAFAPDALFPLGGYPGDEDKARDLFAKLDMGKTAADMSAAARYARGVAGGNGKLGAVGFCWGGGLVNALAAEGELAAAVPFYGVAPPLPKVAQIRSPLLLVFASEDPRINATWPPYEAALKAAGKRYAAVTFPNTQHGFHNDTTPRYDEAAARQAWSRTLAFFEQNLRAG